MRSTPSQRAADLDAGSTARVRRHAARGRAAQDRAALYTPAATATAMDAIYRDLAPPLRVRREPSGPVRERSCPSTVQVNRVARPNGSTTVVGRPNTSYS